jgi:hypothetical protein
MMKAYVCTMHYTDKVVFHHTIFASPADAIAFCNAMNDRAAAREEEPSFLRAEFTEMQLDDRAIAVKALLDDVRTSVAVDGVNYSGSPSTSAQERAAMRRDKE